MEQVNRDGLRSVVPSDADEEKQRYIDILVLCGFSKEVAEARVHENFKRQGIESSVDATVHIRRSELGEEEKTSLNSVCTDMEKDAQFVEDSKTVDSEDENYLSNKYPYFNVMFARSHVKRPYELNIPDNFLPDLRHVTVPVVIRCGGKNWNMSCIKNGEKRMFCAKWREFVNGNDLKIGDACVFELRKCSVTQIKFKVIILKNDVPPELLEKIQCFGGTQEKPIELD